MKYICFKYDGAAREFTGFYEKGPNGYSFFAWPNEAVGALVAIVPGKTAEQSLFEHLCVHNWPNNSPSDFELVPLLNEYGEYYPRMYRPSFAGRRPMTAISFSEIYVKDWYKDKSNIHYQPYPINAAAYSKAINQLGVLKAALVELLRIIDPHPNNFDTFGDQIRNLIILACTEVESQWKGVLRANKYISRANDFNTNDYVKLADPLRLKEYSVSLPLYPDCSVLEPFVTWSPLRPSQSLEWYQAYNDVKHDRESNFQKAKLKYAIQAVLAVAIMNIAQFGQREFWMEEFGSFFTFQKVPTWNFEELYNFGPMSSLKEKCFAF